MIRCPRPGLLCLLLSTARGGEAAVSQTGWLAPGILALSDHGSSLHIARARSHQILTLDLRTTNVVQAVALDAEPTGIGLAAKPARLLVTCSGPANCLAVVDPGTAEERARWAAGPGVCSPVVSPEKGLLYVCQRYEATVGVFDLGTGKPVARIAVIREPVAAALTPDERWLIVGNHLPAGPANAKTVAAAVTIIDTTSFTVRPIRGQWPALQTSRPSALPTPARMN